MNQQIKNIEPSETRTIQEDSTVKPSKLWSRNFITFIIGMELSLISDSLLRFALPLYILIHTGNPAVMGMVLALGHVPYIILGPFGGIAADRLSKRRILILMNLVSGVVVFSYLLITQLFYAVPFTVILFFMIGVLGSLVSPSAEASIPILVPMELLEKANSVTFILTILSSVGVPILGGFIMSRAGITPIMMISAVCFIMAAFVKGMTKIPFTKQKMEYGVMKTGWIDLRDAFIYLLHKNRYLCKVIILIALVNAILNPILTTGMPILISTYMGRGESVIGLIQGIIIFGGTIGVISLQFFGGKAGTKLMGPIILIASLILTSTGVVLVVVNGETFRFVYLIVTFTIVFALTSVLEVVAFTLIGQITSELMMGKIMAIMVSFMVLGYAIGDLLYGFILGRFILHSNPGYGLMIFACVGAGIAIFTNMKKN